MSNEGLSLKLQQWTGKACQKVALGVVWVVTTAFATMATATIANDQPGADLRWFDVEVIVFKQDSQRHADTEYFPLPIQAIPLQRHLDLITEQRRTELMPALAVIPSCVGDVEASESEIEIDNLREWFLVIQRLRQLSEPAFLSSKRLNRPLCRETMVDRLLSGEYLSQLGGALDSWASDVAIDGTGGDMLSTDQPFLLPSNDFELTELKRQLERQSGKELLLHTSWRQPVFNRNQGRKIRLYGGKNYTPFYDYLGFAREPSIKPIEQETYSADPNRLLAQQQVPLQRIHRLLNQIDNGHQPFTRPDVQAAGLPERPAQYPTTLPEDVWQFDGLMHIYLVGNYLHIDGEFNLREEVQVPLQATSLEAQANAALRDQRAEADFLRGYYFNQLRRVISHETHYFDHPNFGVIVQIRRTELSGRR